MIAEWAFGRNQYSAAGRVVMTLVYFVVCDHILDLSNSRTVGRNGRLAEIDMRAAARVVLILVCFGSPPSVCVILLNLLIPTAL